MDGNARSRDTSPNIGRLLKARDINSDMCRIVERDLHFPESMLRRLTIETELKGHQGCVNCLEWTADGMRLASGSDDTHVIIWDPFSHRFLKSIPTGHVGNIFSVKFVGDKSYLATGAGDCRVVIQSLIQPSDTSFLDCRCHTNRVKRLATAPDEPSIFWSAAEDGTVMQYDLRVPHDCQTKNQLFINLHNLLEFKCIAINPMRTNLLALGASDCLVRMYDRRKIEKLDKDSFLNVNSQKYTGCVEYYSPAHMARDFNSENNYKLAATYVSFDATGSNMLVNIGGEHVYLFDVLNPRLASEFKIPEEISKSKNSKIVERTCCLKNRQFNKDRFNSNLSNYDIIIANSPCTCDYMNRAQRYLHRKWQGDSYCAARDFLTVIQHRPDARDAYLGLIQALAQLSWFEEAFKWLERFDDAFPGVSSTLEYKELHSDLKDELQKKNGKLEQMYACSDDDKRARLSAQDFENRFIGHCNTTTDIKEVNFFGRNGNYICAGSDDGIIFIWDRKTTNIVSAMLGDVSIVNCVQPHPTVCLLASSGIDSAVKLWTPSVKDDDPKSHVVTSIWAAVEANQQRMAMDPFETMLANMGYRFSPGAQDLTACRPS